MRTSEGFVTAPDGVRLFFQTMGSGPQLVVPNGIYFSGDFQRVAESRTLVCYDPRNRGRSDAVTDPGKLARGVLQDADDLEIVRRHFAINRMDVMAHSYMGAVAALYAKYYPGKVNRAILIGPIQPDASKTYPAHLTGADAGLAEILSKLAQLRNEPEGQARCQKFWSILRPLYVVNPADAERIRWDRCELANERNLMKYYSQHVLPSIQRLAFSAADFEDLRAPVLIIHGTKDRSSPYGGGRDWSSIFPDARLLTVENAGHAPWIEAPELVFGGIRVFLDGEWPEAARDVRQ